MASVLGTARSRAIFLSCLALVMIFSGITAVALVKDNGQPDNVSSTVEKSKDTTDTKNDTPQLKGLGKQETKTPATEQSSSQSQPTTSDQSTPNQGNSSTTKQTAASSFDFTLSKPAHSISSGDNTDTLTATTGDGTAVTWQVQLTCDTDQAVRATITQNNNAQFIAQLQASKDAPHDTKCQGVLTAKDASRNINVQKQFTVTVL